MTPDGPGTTSPNRSGADRAGSGDRRNTKRPVRSAPIRRGRPAGKKPSKPAAPVPPVDEPGTAAEDVDSASPTSAEPTQDATSTASPAADTAPDSESVAAEIAPDPSEVEKTVSYRERWRARTAAASASTGTPKRKRGIRYRGSGRRSPRAVVGVVVALVVIVVCAIASVVFALGIARQDRTDDLRAEYSAFASQVLVNLTSMNPDTVDQTLTSVQEDTSGKVKQEVENNIQQVAALVRDGKLETRSLILSSAVTKAEPDEGSVIMVFGWHQRSLDGEVPSQEKVFRWRVDMTRINGDLKMTDFEWVA
ncbi:MULTISPECIES: hypothetical protein [unclassified Gordonia (in: high G+C Gram-positive bacteria)]|uniref:hypothetical protein n=1 Tax=unclassified Gordonia (in: high G+C Gram-positive bacteria) TaxID=2657482 RepID=UPI001964C760|nr:MULTISPECIES: hypothetical protein [unclassified Gordonia (in: high G+C Gram-positive bacteria)]MBN0974932.1 hypothetical protein [Gordonia sp. BP-119]MBN0984929.1 hypothetical protein [Gordonia sp. BP-94]